MTAVPLGRRAAILFASLGIATLDWGVKLIRSSKSGDGLMNRNVFALFGAVAALLSVPVVLTLSRATPFASGIGTLKCYDVTGSIKKPCDQPPLIVRTSALRD
jgi:hypothetical protein